MAEQRVVLTFDDGFANVFQSALPALLQFGFTAITFLVADRKTNAWDAEWGRGDYPLMDCGQVREWLAAGQEIGAHTLSHPYLTKISLPAARREIFECKARLEDRFQRPVVHFCYPYGDSSPAVRDLVMEAGFETACSTTPGFHSPVDDPFAMRRWMASHPRPIVAAWLPHLLERYLR